MFLLRLYHRHDPDLPIAAHMLREGKAAVGRDPDADWTVPDPDCEISRRHLELTCVEGILMLRPLGGNGVFRDGDRLADGVEAQLGLGDSVEFGQYRMVVDAMPFAAQSGTSFEGTLAFAAPFGTRRGVPMEWPDADEDQPGYDDGSLLEAFCEGAKLDVSALSGVDSVEIMRRAGAIYRQMVLGLGDLVSERSTARADLSLDCTTIGAFRNNPFKWAPTRRLATDLLLEQGDGFLKGPEAIRASFEDVKAHMIGTLAGFGAALQAAVVLVSPETIERRAIAQASLLKSRAAICWAEYETAHSELRAQVLTQSDGPLAAAFLTAYATGAGRDAGVEGGSLSQVG